MTTTPEPSTVITVYRNNRTDQAEPMTLKQLVSSFLSSEARKTEGWPVERQLGVWLCDIGTLDEDEHTLLREAVYATIEAGW